MCRSLTSFVIHIRPHRPDAYLGLSLGVIVGKTLNYIIVMILIASFYAVI